MRTRERDQDPEAFRCLDCETPIRRGRFCGACRPERLDDDLGQTLLTIAGGLSKAPGVAQDRTFDCRECGGTPRTDHRLWCSGRRLNPFKKEVR